MKSLESLYLNNNQIESIFESTFLGLDNLKCLKLNDNCLKFIHFKALKCFSSNLFKNDIYSNEKFDLSNNQIYDLVLKDGLILFYKLK